MHVPAAEHLARFCMTERHRRCEVFRSFLDALTVKPGQGRLEGRGATAPPPLERRSVKGRSS